MVKLPTDLNSKWVQPNNSDKFGSVWMTKNINFNEEGYAKLSPRTVLLADESQNADFGIPLAIGLYASGQYVVATSSDANFDLTVSTTALTVEENSGTLEPTLTTNSHAVWWQNLWFASTATAVLSRAATSGATGTWTSRVTGLTSGVRHHMAVFASRTTLCITNGNSVKQYDTSYVAGTTLTIPSDFEAIGLAYNNSKMGVITRLGDNTNQAQDAEARFFVWDGTTTGAQSDAGVGCSACVAVCPYKSSFVVLTKIGELLYWNGGGFDTLATFPFYSQDKIWGTNIGDITLGSSMIPDGDVIYINVGLSLNSFGRRSETIVQNAPSGVWCFNPSVGLHHRWSGSTSHAYCNSVSDANVNTTTNVMTITSGTIPATGGIARLSASSNGIGGLTTNYDYYIIKSSSTTFKLATTKENALLEIAIDLTSAGSGGLNFFWMYDLTDYGTSFYGIGSTGAGSISLPQQTNALYQDVIFGGDFKTTSLVGNDAICTAIPFLENRGYLVTPKVFSDSITDSGKKVTVKFRPLGENDKIIIKQRTKDVYGLPVTSSGNEANWTSTNEFYTDQDLSEAKEYIDSGGNLEVEFLSGAGGGQMVQITSISSPSSNVYALVLEDDVLGASSGLKAEYIINNWKVLETIDNSSNEEGFKEISIRDVSKWFQLKIELRGYNVTIEEIIMDNKLSTK